MSLYGFFNFFYFNKGVHLSRKHYDIRQASVIATC